MTNGDKPQTEKLTPRQQQVLQGYAKGLIAKQIAFELGIKEVSVNLHAANARKKLGAETLAQAVQIFTTREAAKTSVPFLVPEDYPNCGVVFIHGQKMFLPQLVNPEEWEARWDGTPFGRK